MRFALPIAILASLGLVPGNAGAVSIFSAFMTGDQAVPPNSSPTQGVAAFALQDTHEFAYDIYLQGGPLSSPETSCHIHGPARPGHTAPVLYALPRGSTKQGCVGVLADSEVVQLQDGLWYCDLHTQLYPDGEIRCQIINITAQTPTTWGAVKALFRSQ